MNATDILIDAAHRPADQARLIIDGLSPKEAGTMPGGRGNSITWLIWHAGRQMDVQLSALTGAPTVWEDGQWAGTLGIDRAADDFGFGDTADDVASLTTDNLDGLAQYLQACTEALISYVGTLTEADLSEIIDRSYEPPVSRGTRLVSIIDDAAVHLGQAAYVRGLNGSWRYPV